MPDRKTPWLLSSLPLSPTAVFPGRLITSRTNPQNFYDPSEYLPQKPECLARIDRAPFEHANYIDVYSRDTKLSLTLGSFANQFFTKGKQDAASLSACHGVQYLLLQADEWIARICTSRHTREWLEKRVRRERKRVWLVTGIVTLADADVSLGAGGTFGVGLGAAVPLTAALGLPVPTPVDPGAEVEVDWSKMGTRHFTVPGEKVFEVQYHEVKLATRFWGDLTRDEGMHDEFALRRKAMWRRLVYTRSTPYSETVNTGGDEEDEGEEEDEEEDEEIMQAVLADGIGDEAEKDDEEDEAEDLPIVLR